MFLLKLADLVEPLPGGRLAVGVNDDFTALTLQRTEGVAGGADAAGQIGGPVAQGRQFQAAAKPRQVGGGFGNERIHAAGHQIEGQRGARSQLVKRLADGLAALLKTRGHAVALSHARGIVEKHHRRRRSVPAGKKPGHQGPENRPGKGHYQRHHHQAAQDQQNQVLDLQPAAVFPQAVLHKPHRRPARAPNPEPVQQMNGHRHGHRRQTRQHPWIQKAHHSAQEKGEHRGKAGGIILFSPSSAGRQGSRSAPRPGSGPCRQARSACCISRRRCARARGRR